MDNGLWTSMIIEVQETDLHTPNFLSKSVVDLLMRLLQHSVEKVVFGETILYIVVDENYLKSV